MQYAINLFPHSRNSLGKRMSYFGVHYLRYILVLTQLVVVISFFYRFTIDQQITDAKEALGQKKAIIETTQAMRDDLQKKQQTILHVQELLKRQETWSEQFDYVTSVFPRGVTVTMLSIEREGTRIAGSASSATLIQSFYQRLLNEKQFESITLSSMVRSRTGGSGYDFEILTGKFQIPKS